ncbi:MAG: hypothetical protein HW384_954 [Dehalococcoidia bacterium]|nr:hypothetical protein [Dehalococcoidia bacterium]MBF8303773.1 hypothetical protein [Dehalococcoidia bacterium]
MEVKFKLFGLTDIIHETEAIIGLSAGSSLLEAMNKLAEKYGDTFKQRILKDNGLLQDYVRVVVGQRIVDRLDETVEEGATIFILHEIAGG